ncbi:methyltransferase [Nocardiopsis potens]|uniref:methyltransferase n=1 Tax=Nocardiopsis potens TaxID=1246458 RepID=UPI000349312E|nr:methyltransferase [Nocardiopsis potens]
MADTEFDIKSLLPSLVFGYITSRIVSASVVLGVPDALGEGTRPAGEVAEELGCAEGPLQRMLRALVVIGLTEEAAPGEYRLTEAGRWFRSDVEGSVRPYALMAASPGIWRAWSGTEEAVRTGGDAFRAANGKGLFDYLEEEPEFGRAFDGVMAGNSGLISPAIVKDCDFSGDGAVMDVGGGSGVLLSSILAADPGIRGVLYDLPDVVAEAGPVLEAAGVADRCEVRAGSFFDSVPEFEGAVLLKNLLNDWNDEDVLRILGKCREALGDRKGRLLIVAPIVPERVTPDDAIAVIGDFEMLVTTGGKERSAREYEALLASAGFRLDRVVPLSEFPQYSIVHGTPV